MTSLMQRYGAWNDAAGARQLSRELRKGGDELLRNRRDLAKLELVAIGAMATIALYQMGIIDHLPEPALPGLDADRVDAAPEAYRTLNMPDAVLGLRSYASTLALAGMGGADRAREHPWIPLALAAKAVFDAAQAGRLTWRQLREHRGVCSYCLLASVATWAALPLVLPEAREALRELAG